MAYHRVELGGKLHDEWDGELAASVSTRTPDRTRWVEISVYHLDDGGWLAHRAGMSNIYHRAATACRRANGRKPGALGGVDDLPDDAEPCGDCNPPYPEDLADDAKIRFEFPQHTINRGTPEQIVRALTTSRRPDTGQRVVKVSAPVEDLLGELSSSYPEFASLGEPAERVTGPLGQGEDNDEGHDFPGSGRTRRPENDQGPASRLA